MPRIPSHADLVLDVIDLVVDAVNLRHVDKGSITVETPLTDAGLELDSVDILEILVAVEHRYGVKVKDMQMGRQIFRTIGTIADFVQSQQT